MPESSTIPPPFDAKLLENIAEADLSYRLPVEAGVVLEGLIARWLDQHENHWTTVKFNAGIEVYSACHGRDVKKLGEGPSRLVALARACRRILEERA